MQYQDPRQHPEDLCGIKVSFLTLRVLSAVVQKKKMVIQNFFYYEIEQQQKHYCVVPLKKKIKSYRKLTVPRSLF